MTPNTNPQPDLFGNERPTDSLQNPSSRVFTSPVDQFPFLAPQQPAQQAAQPVAPQTATEAVVIDLNVPNNTVTLSPDHNDEIYDNDDSYRELLETPTFRRMQEVSSVQAERMEKLVSPGNAVPQASYSQDFFFTVIPSVD